MILCDVNVLLGAFIASTPHHQRCSQLLEGLRSSGESFAISDLILAAVMRIATNPKIFQPAVPTAEAFAFADAWRAHPQAVTIAPADRHWRIFRDLVEPSAIRGADTTDAYLAALAIEHGCEWWTADRGFTRFPGLRFRYILSEDGRVH